MSQPVPDDRARIQLALAVLNHRKPAVELLDLIRLILLGATIQDCLDMERPRPTRAVRP